jgi:hypothetical protein
MSEFNLIVIIYKRRHGNSTKVCPQSKVKKSEYYNDIEIEQMVRQFFSTIDIQTLTNATYKTP